MYGQPYPDGTNSLAAFQTFEDSNNRMANRVITSTVDAFWPDIEFEEGKLALVNPPKQGQGA